MMNHHEADAVAGMYVAIVHIAGTPSALPFAQPLLISLSLRRTKSGLVQSFFFELVGIVSI